MPDSPPTPAQDPPGSASSPAAEPIWPERRLKPSRARAAVNAIAGVFTEWGVIPHTYLMTTRGRKSRQLRSTPVTVVQDADRTWLVAPYGPVPWVLNVRAAGLLTLRRGRHVAMYSAREVPDFDAAGPVLKKYLAIAAATRPYFSATKDSPVEAFIAEASRHPVFELTRTA